MENAVAETGSTNEVSESMDGNPEVGKEVSDKPKREVSRTEDGKYILKYKGKEETVDEYEMWQRAQKATGADRRFDEANKLAKDAETKADNREREILAQIVAEANKDPQAFISSINPNYDWSDFAQKKILELIELEGLTPDQKEAREYKKKYETLNEKTAREAKEAQQKQADQFKAHERERFTRTTIDALEKNGDLPKNAETVRRIHGYMHKAYDHMRRTGQMIEISPADFIPLVKEDYLNDMRHLFGDLPEDKLLATLDKDFIKKINKATVQSNKNPFQSNQAKSTSNGSSTKGTKFMDETEWRAAVERRINS